MSQARKVFSMRTFVSLLRGVDRQAQAQEVADLVGFMAGVPLDAALAPFAAALAKAWIYEQHPELATMSAAALAASAQNVSVTALPPEAAAEAADIFTRLTAAQKTAAEQAARIETLEGELAARTAQFRDVEARLTSAEQTIGRLEAASREQGDALVVASAAKVRDFIGQVDTLLGKIEAIKQQGLVAAPAGEVPRATMADSPPPSAAFSLGDDFFAAKW